MSYVDLNPEGVNKPLMWAVAAEGCKHLNITLDRWFRYGFSDEWPKDERVEALWLAFGPPLAQDLEQIAQWFRDLEDEG